MELIETCSSLKALINITSDGLLNMTRVQANVGFIIDKLPEPQPIFGLIQTLGDDPVAPNEMFEVYNMGVGFCVIVGQGEADLVIEILKKHGRKSQRIGNAVRDPMKKVHLTQHNLVGRGKTFRSNASGSR
jgi:phosphoribosylformylglycinamidine cyclo-ligase